MDTVREPAADLYVTFAREEAADRGRLRASVVVALLLHAALLAAPWPQPAPRRDASLPATAATPFRLQNVRFLPPQPPPEPVPEPPRRAEEPPVEREPPTPEPEPPPRASAELLVPLGPAGSLVPPQPVSTPPPPYPERLWEQGLGGEVVLTLVIDPFGQVVEIEREEGPESLLDAAVQTVRRWTFLPATLDGHPISTAISVRVTFPRPPAPSAPAGHG